MAKTPQKIVKKYGIVAQHPSKSHKEKADPWSAFWILDMIEMES